MLHALRSLALLLILLAGSAGAAETKPFAREDMASDAVRLTDTLRVATAAIGAQVKGKTPQQLLAEAARTVGSGDFASAEGYLNQLSRIAQSINDSSLLARCTAYEIYIRRMRNVPPFLRFRVDSDTGPGVVRNAKISVLHKFVTTILGF